MKTLLIQQAPAGPEPTALEITSNRYFKHNTLHEYCVLTQDYYRVYMFDSPYRFSTYVSSMRIYANEEIHYKGTLWSVLRGDEWTELTEKEALDHIQEQMLISMNQDREETL